MVRRTYYNGSQKTITGLVPQTILWTNAEVPGERVIAYHFALQGAAGANGLDDVEVDAPVVRFVNKCLLDAIRKGAS
ncbi:MAG: hypothetical protein L0191_10200, partial [Acidobacteria bacterium]|nr:hypothetical protein [Acidobacteriota bacterium]